ncbi:zinc finger protein 808-like isoform X1 [Tigriopus californicus]|uniref:zinc finger protein 808-like isoform X1 n=1 Tax=Tigriopus californicus TaxID=6832 RepID=UPI0027DA6B4B|nr:zinc finger protein 808-like isoform X1 [Tigriopus californicus]
MNMASDQEPIDWTQLHLSEDLQLLDFDPWIVITRQTLDFDTKGNKPFISMMMFLDTKSRVFILSVVYRTYKEGPIQNLEQVNQLIHEFFEDRHPCWGYGSDEDLPRPYSHQYATKCTVLVAKQGDQCGWCYEKYLSIESNDDSGTNMDSILEDLVENAMDSKPLFEVRDRGSDQGNCGKEISMEEPLGGSEYCPIVDDMENTIDNTDKLDALENKPDQEDQAAHNYNRTLIPCPLCEKSFKSSYSLRAHHRRSHQCENSNPVSRGKLLEYQRNVQCSICDAQFRLGKQLFPHLKTIHQLSDEEIMKSFHVPKCWICHRAFATLSIQTMHKKRDHLLGKWQCSVCLEVLRHGQELHDHYETQHKPEEFKVKCSMCQKELCFTNGFHTVLDHWASCLKLKNIESRSKTSSRSESKRFVCDECGRFFQFKSALSDHQDEHQGILKHECSKCDYKTGTASKLTAHRKYWHSARARKFQKKTLVSCEICGTQVEQSYLSRHIANNHETPAWPCNECEKRFGTEITLKRHKSTVHSKTMVDCQVCGVQVKCAEKLKVHMAIHLPPKYFCRFCGKGLKSTVSLGNHERKVHTGENPYRCETCPFACASSGELLLHKKRQHNVPKVHFYKYMKNASSK